MASTLYNRAQNLVSLQNVMSTRYAPQYEFVIHKSAGNAILTDYLFTICVIILREKRLLVDWLRQTQRQDEVTEGTVNIFEGR